MAGYRCTVDCLDDYIGIQSVFLNVHDPVKEPVLKLISSLVGKRYQPCHKEPVKKLVFGTAQLGFNYGIANKTGKPSQLQCMDMLKTAIANGVVYLDTAHAYGESEMALGSSLKDGWLGRVKVITKLSPLDACPSTSEIQTLKAFVDMSIYKSLSALRAQKLDILMLHRASHLYDWNGSAWGRLLEHKENGLICSLGVSVQNPEELLLSLNIPEVEYIQLPFNLIDWRWDEILPQIIREKEKRKLNIHVRSIFLQGLLLTNCEDSWKRANVSDSLNVISWLSDQVNIFHRDNIADLCFAYVNSLHWIDGIVVGMESMDQLKQNIKNLNATPLTMSQVEEINRSRPKLLEISLNPAKWG